MMRGLSPTPLNDAATFAASLGAEVAVGSGEHANVIFVRVRSYAARERVVHRMAIEASQNRWPRGAFAMRYLP